MRVVVIEDDEGIRAVICEILKLRSLSCVALIEGAPALEFVKQNLNLDIVVFVDLVTPGMNGWEFIRQVQEYRRGGKLKLVVVTGLRPYQTSQLSGQVDKIIEKPFEVDVILKTIEQFEGELKKVG